MSVELKESPTIFELAERKDEMQIMNFDSNLKKEYVYEIQGKPVLSYVGIKHAVILMANAGNPLSIVSEKTELLKPDPEDKLTWFWDSTIVIKNTNNGLETLGNASATLYKGNTMQEFSKRTAMSKAERNAQRKQLPEQLLANLIAEVGAEKTVGSQTVKKDLLQTEDYCDQSGTRCKAAPPSASGRCMECGKVRRPDK